MKRSFVYLAAALMLSLLLSGCGDSTEHGNVAASPWPGVTEPALPLPTSMVSASPIPDFIPDNEVSGTNSDANYGMNSSGMTGSGTGSMTTSSPIPTETNR